MSGVWFLDREGLAELQPSGAIVRPQMVSWSARSNYTSWTDDDARSMPVARFLRYGINGGRLGKRMRRLRQQQYDAAIRAPT